MQETGGIGLRLFDLLQIGTAAVITLMIMEPLRAATSRTILKNPISI